MRERLQQPKAHDKQCLAFRRHTPKDQRGPKRCICGKERWLWMYQPGDILQLDIRGQSIQVAYAWDVITDKKRDANELVKALQHAGCHIRITDGVGPTMWLPPWTPVEREVKLYAPPLMADNEDTDPLKGR